MRVPPVPVTDPNHDEGAPGPSLLGTGETTSPRFAKVNRKIYVAGNYALSAHNTNRNQISLMSSTYSNSSQMRENKRLNRLFLCQIGADKGQLRPLKRIQ